MSSYVFTEYVAKPAIDGLIMNQKLNYQLMAFYNMKKGVTKTNTKFGNNTSAIMSSFSSVASENTEKI